MLRLVPDRTTYRWGDPVTVQYQGDVDDLGTFTAVDGHMLVADEPTSVTFAGNLVFRASYVQPILAGYRFVEDPDDATSWVGTAVEGSRPTQARTVTVAGAVVTLRGTATVSCAVAMLPRMTVGWCPGFRQGESEDAAMRRMLADYPGSEYGAIRIFHNPGEGFGRWDTGHLAHVPPTADLVVSGKDWPVDVAGWLAAMPKRTGRTYLCLYHEPEQQTGGDPLPAVYKQHWAELAVALDGHPRRGELGLMPIYTRYYWARNAGAFDTFFPTAVQSKLAAVGFDCYDQLLKRTVYETPVSLFTVPLAVGARTGLDVAICELGIRRLDTDVDGTGCAAALKAHIAYARAQGVLGIMWFHRDMDQHHDLTAEPVRVPERDALAAAIQGA